MSENKASDVEVFVHNKMVVSFACPQCKQEKSIGVDRIRDVTHWGVNATCRRCSHKFKVSFNFRKFYRKETYLHGMLYESYDTTEAACEVRVTDVSLTGIGFECPDRTLEAGNVLVVRFILDDEEKSAVEKEISVTSVRGTKVGAVFTETKGFDKILGKYILPK